MTETITSYCRMCPASCGLRVTVDNGAVVRLAGDRDIQLSSVFAQYTPSVVPLRGMRRPVWWSMAKLAERLRLDILPGGLDPDACTDTDICAQLASGLPAPWERVRDSPGPIEFAAEERWVERTALPDGRWDLAPAALVGRLDDALDQPTPKLVLGNRRERTHTNSTLTWNTSSHPATAPRLYLSPADAKAAGVCDGDQVQVTSPHGCLVASARLESAMSPGTVAVPHGFTEPNVGHLTSTDLDLDPLTGMPKLVGVPVTLRVVSSPA